MHLYVHHRGTNVPTLIVNVGCITESQYGDYTLSCNALISTAPAVVYGPHIAAIWGERKHYGENIPILFTLWGMQYGVRSQ